MFLEGFAEISTDNQRKMIRPKEREQNNSMTEEIVEVM